MRLTFDWRNWLTTHGHLRLVFISVLLGMVSGIGAVLFLLGLEYASSLLQGGLMGVHHPHPTGEHLRFGLDTGTSGLRPWLIVLIPTLGGMLSGLLVNWLAPEAEGHGMDATIRAFHHHKGSIRARVPFVKAIASILTIGSGGSGGREGPIAQIGGGFGSWLADRFRLPARERRALLLAGSAGGIGAIFRAPLGGAISMVEILYKEDFESPAIIPCVVSSVTSYACFRWFLSLHFIGIESPTIYSFPGWDAKMHSAFPFVILTGIFCALMGKVFVVVFRVLRQRLFPRLPGWKFLRPTLGGLLVGLIGLVWVKTLGAGHGYLQDALNMRVAGQPREVILPIMWGFLLLALLKILTTSLTIGSGGSGGVFGPSLLIGGLTGAAVGCCCHAWFPGLGVPPMSAFVVLGMAGFFSSVARAPLGAVIMVCEMTGSYTMLAPLLLVCVVALLVNRKYHLYDAQLETRLQSPAHQAALAVNVLADLAVKDYFRAEPPPMIPITATGRELRQLLMDGGTSFPLPVIDEHGKPVGILTLGNLCITFFKRLPGRRYLVREAMSPLVVCHVNETLASALEKFTTSRYGRIPVVPAESPDRIVGVLQYQDVLEAYTRELSRRQFAD